jgi:hypothetical protein
MPILITPAAPHLSYYHQTLYSLDTMSLNNQLKKYYFLICSYVSSVDLHYEVFCIQFT